MYQITPSPVTQHNPRLTTTCPECEIQIHFSRPPALREVIYCIECDTNLEVVQKYPLKLDWFFEEPFENEEDNFWEDESLDYIQDDFWEN